MNDHKFWFIYGVEYHQNTITFNEVEQQQHRKPQYIYIWWYDFTHMKRTKLLYAAYTSHFNFPGVYDKLRDRKG